METAGKSINLSSADTGNKRDDNKIEVLRKQENSPERLSQLFDCNHPPNGFVPPSSAPINVILVYPNSSANRLSEEVNDEDVDITLRYFRIRKDSPGLPLMDTTLRTCDGLYRCRICRRVFLNRFSLTGHYRSHYDTTYVVKPHHCHDRGQGCASTSSLCSHGQKHYVLRTRNKKDKTIPKVNPHSTRSSKSGPIRRSDTESKRKCIKSRQTERVHKTQMDNLRNKFSGNSKTEEPTGEASDAPDVTERARLPIKPRNLDTRDGLSKGSQIEQSVGTSEKPSVREGLRTFNLPTGGGSNAYLHSKNTRGDEEANTAAQPDLGECIKIPQSWNQRDKESQKPCWLKLTYQESNPTESPESSQANGKIQPKQILQQSYQSEKMPRQLFAITSGATLSALSPINSINSQTFWTILHSARSAFTRVNRNHTTPNFANQFMPCVPEPVHANSLNGDAHTSIKPVFDPLCPSSRPFYPLVYACLCRLTDARALGKQISFTPSSPFESWRPRQPSESGVWRLSEDIRAFSPDSPCSHSLCCNFPANERSTSKSSGTSALDM